MQKSNPQVFQGLGNIICGIIAGARLESRKIRSYTGFSTLLQNTHEMFALSFQ